MALVFDIYIYLYGHNVYGIEDYMFQHDPTFAIITCIDGNIYKIDELSDN